MTKMTMFEAIVVGGGMMGASMALGLARAGWKVAIVEQGKPPFYQPKSQRPDLRVSALTVGSLNFLTSLGLFARPTDYPLASFTQLETWEQAQNSVVFDAQQLRLPELGWMVENQMVQQTIWDQFQVWDNLVAYSGISILNMQQQQEIWHLHLSSGECLTSSLIIAADGANSMVRRQVGIGVTGWQYRQSCLLLTVQLEQQLAGHTTWQEFQPDGPKAYLPLWDNWACLVWYDQTEQIKQLMQLDDSQLQKMVSQHFPARLPAFKLVDRGCFALTRQHALSYFKSGVVLVGDAAHTINPLAGQGANLGYRDVACLLKILIESQQASQNVASDQVLARYQRQRYPDNLLMQNGMDLFYQVFSQQNSSWKRFRNMGLSVAQHSGPLKRWALKYALGL